MNQEVTTNQLAIMIANGFMEVDKKFDKKFDEVNRKIDYIYNDLKSEIHDLQAANYVSKFEHKRLVQRVEVLEDKIV